MPSRERLVLGVLLAACVTTLCVLREPASEGRADSIAPSTNEAERAIQVGDQGSDASQREALNAPRHVVFRRASDKLPVPGVLAWLVAERALEGLSERGDVLVAAQRDGRALVADDRGGAQLPEITAPHRLVALTRDSWGMRNVSCDGSEAIECVLEPARWLRVRVEGARGDPAPGILIEVGGVGGIGSFPFEITSSARASAPEGIAWLAMDRVEATLPQGPWLCPRMIATPRLWRRILPEELARGEFVLRLPPRGTVVFELRDERGHVVRPGELGVRGLCLGIGGSHTRFDPNDSSDSGTLRFSDIQAGISHRLAVELDSDWSTVLEAAQVPEVHEDGQIVRAIATVRVRGAWLEGRAVLADGRAVPASARMWRRACGCVRVPIEPGGQFSYSCGAGEPESHCFQVEIPRDQNGPEAEYEATISVPALARGARSWVGELRFVRTYVGDHAVRGRERDTEPPPEHTAIVDARPFRFAITRDRLIRHEDLCFELRPKVPGAIWTEESIDSHDLVSAHGDGASAVEWRVRLRASDEVLARGERAGECAGPPARVDLRGAVHAHWLEIVGESGEVLGDANVRCLHRAAEGHEGVSEQAPHWSPGAICVVTAARSPDVLVSMDSAGMQPQVLRGIGALTRVVLREGPAIDVTLNVREWPAGIAIETDLECVDTYALDVPRATIRPFGCWFSDAGARNRTRLPVLGRYVLRCTARTAGGGQTFAETLPSVLHLDIRDPTIPIVIDVPQHELDEAVRSIRRQSEHR